jgi:dimethylargininase
MLVALTREVPPSIARCELTHLAREPIDHGRAAAQHRAYEEALAELGCVVQRLPAEPEMPDSVFVEDAAVVVDEIAVLARPGAESRRGETASVAAALAEHRPVVRISAPGTLDGGDVLRIGQDLWVGLSGRSSPEGVRQLAALLAPFGYQVRGVPVSGCLHLKTAVTHLAARTVLANPHWVAVSALADDLEVVEVHPDEPMGATALPIGDTVLYPTAFPRTRERIEARGLRVRALDASELARAEGALTCCSIIFQAQD